MTFDEWTKKNPTVGFTQRGECKQVFTNNDHTLFHLVDYVVTSALGGPSLMLSPRTSPDVRKTEGHELVVRVLDSVREYLISELPIACVGNRAEVMDFANTHKLTWKPSKSMLFGGYYANLNEGKEGYGNCYYIT